MEFLLLGPLEVWHDGASLTVGQRRAERCLLGLLLLETGRLVSQDRLIDLLWDSQPPDRAHAILQTHVSRLRSAVDPHRDGRYGVRLRRHNSGYLLEADPNTVDGFRFRAAVLRAENLIDATQRAQALREALALWRGPVLADVATDRLRDRIGTGLAELRLHAWEMCMEAELSRGRHREIIPELGELVTANPMRERPVGCLMLALYRDGRQAHALDVFNAARDRIVEATGLDPSTDLVQLRDAIIRGEPVETLATWRLVEGPAHRNGIEVSPARPVPRQLPAAPPHFVGRQAELTALSALADRPVETGTVVISAVAGMAGVGKTALAVTAGHRLADRYGDGQLFVDLHGFTAGMTRLEPLEALDRLLQAVGVPQERIPAGLDERAALWRSVLAGRRMLILLDNAATEAQVLPLLPGATGSLVLVTSRRRLTALEATHAVSLDTLPQADAMALFTRTSGRPESALDAGEVREVVRLCGYLPLAIRIVAARLKHRPVWTVADLVQRLRELDCRLSALDDGRRNVHATLHLSYRDLPANEQRMYRLLGLHPGPDVDSYAAAALLDGNLDQVRRRLDRLVDDHLLEEPAPGRYRFHDLVRAHAADTADRAESVPRKEAALDRLLDHYRQTAAAAMDLAHPYERRRRPAVRPAGTPTPPLVDRHMAERWLDTELTNLLAVTAHAATHDRPEHAWQLAAILDRHLCTRGRHHDARTLRQQAVDVARKVGDRAAEADALNGLGYVHFVLGDFEQATADYTRALRIVRGLADRGGEVHALIGLGHVHRIQGGYEQATANYHEASRIAQEIGDRSGQLQALTNLGHIHRMLDRYAAAADHYRRAVRIAWEIGDGVDQMQALQGLGHIHRMLDQHTAAAERYRQALLVAQDIGDGLGQLQALTGVGHIHRMLKRYADAADHYRRALRIAQDIGNRFAELNPLNGLAAVHRLLGDNGEAAQRYRQVLDLAEELGSNNWRYEALQGLGRIHHATGRPDLALIHHAQALQSAVELTQPKDQARAHDGLAHAHHALNDHDQARHHWRQALDILVGLGADHTEDAEASVPNIRAHLDNDER